MARDSGQRQTQKSSTALCKIGRTDQLHDCDCGRLAHPLHWQRTLLDLSEPMPTLPRLQRNSNGRASLPLFSPHFPIPLLSLPTPSFVSCAACSRRCTGTNGPNQWTCSSLPQSTSRRQRAGQITTHARALPSHSPPHTSEAFRRTQNAVPGPSIQSATRACARSASMRLASDARPRARHPYCSNQQARQSSRASLANSEPHPK